MLQNGDFGRFVFKSSDNQKLEWNKFVMVDSDHKVKLFDCLDGQRRFTCKLQVFIGRCVGWIRHLLESLSSDQYVIGKKTDQ